jgi:putative Ca2+/H+ antiporter (TMEM165/GDT1 family)
VGGDVKISSRRKSNQPKTSLSASLSQTPILPCAFFLHSQTPIFHIVPAYKWWYEKAEREREKKIQAIKKISHLLCTFVSLKLNEFLIFKFFFCSGTSWISFLVAALQVWHPKKLSKQDDHQLTSKFQQDTTSYFSLIKSLFSLSLSLQRRLCKPAAVKYNNPSAISLQFLHIEGGKDQSFYSKSFGQDQIKLQNA